VNRSYAITGPPVPLWGGFSQPALQEALHRAETPQRRPWSNFEKPSFRERLGVAKYLPHASGKGGVVNFARSPWAVAALGKPFPEGFCPLPMGNGLGVQKLPAICCKEWGECPLLGTILRPCSWPMPTLPPWPPDALLLALLRPPAGPRFRSGIVRPRPAGRPHPHRRLRRVPGVVRCPAAGYRPTRPMESDGQLGSGGGPAVRLPIQ
jgi:hypothetical protein